MKRIISLLIILSMCLFACSGGQENGTDISATVSTTPSVSEPEENRSGIDDSKSAAENLYSLLTDTINKETATVKLRSEDDGAAFPKSDILIDLREQSFLLEYPRRYGLMDTKVNNVKLGYKDGILYTVEQNEAGKLFGCQRALDGEEENELSWGLKALAKLSLKAEVTDDALGLLGAKLKDGKWVEERLKLTLTEDGKKAIFSVSPDLYGITAEIIELLKDGISEESYDEALSKAEAFKELAPKATLTFSDGILTEVTVSLNTASTMKMTLSHHGTTAVPITELINTLNEAHNGHTECVACGDDEVYFSCYCYSCANRLLCANYCGNPRNKNKEYCTDCYSPCRECGERQAEYNGYCDGCYHLYYCNEDCGRLVTHFAEKAGYGYCDECFKACKECGEHNRDKESEYCYSCQKKYFCGVCGVNSISRRFDSVGYCNDCYTPCPRCKKQGLEEYEGYCLVCFNEKYCNICQKNLITHDAKYGGFCDDCFNPCASCKKHNFSEDSELCFECEAPFCYQCRTNPITRTASNGNGYCDGCYVACRECRKDMCAMIDRLCYECYYNKYCHQCGKNEITHGSGTEHKTCDECYK